VGQHPDRGVDGQRVGGAVPGRAGPWPRPCWVAVPRHTTAIPPHRMLDVPTTVGDPRPDCPSVTGQPQATGTAAPQTAPAQLRDARTQDRTSRSARVEPRSRLAERLRYDLKAIRAFLLKEEFKFFWAYVSAHWGPVGFSIARPQRPCGRASGRFRKWRMLRTHRDGHAGPGREHGPRQVPRLETARVLECLRGLPMIHGFAHVKSIRPRPLSCCAAFGWLSQSPALLASREGVPSP